MGYKNIHVKVKCERSEPEKIEIELLRANSCNLMRAKRAGKIAKVEVSRAKRAENFLKTLHFSPNSSKLRSDYYPLATELEGILSPRNRVGGDIVTLPFVGGWVSEWVGECVRGCVVPSRFTLWTR